MNNHKNLALDIILNANDANSKEQAIQKASSIDDLFVLQTIFAVIDAMKDEVSNFYNQSHPTNSQKNPKGAGRKAYDPSFMLKLLATRSYLDCSDAQLIQQVSTRSDLRDLLGITVFHKLPCPSTIWGYRELFANSDFPNLFGKINVILLNTCCKYMSEQGISTEEVGKIMSVDATHFDALWRRDSKAHNAQIKKGEASAEELYPNPNVRCQKDLEAAFSVKYGQTHFGYKITVLVDSQTRIVINIEVTPGNVHDVKVLEKVVASSKIIPVDLYCDSGYMGDKYEESLNNQYGIKLHTCKRKLRNQPALTEEEKLNNRLNSAVRKNVEHCFAGHKDKKRLRLHGLHRAKFEALLSFMFTNVKRACQICTGRCALKTSKQKQQEVLKSYAVV